MNQFGELGLHFECPFDVLASQLVVNGTSRLLYACPQFFQRHKLFRQVQHLLPQLFLLGLFLTDVYEGKAPEQFEAMWQYLRSLNAR